MSLLDLIVKHILVADVPEVIIRNYLPGDECLDDDTIKLVFTTKYCKCRIKYATYMDVECTVLHSFNDEPASIIQGKNVCSGKYWYYNGKRHRTDDKPAVIYYDGSMYWYFNDKLHREDDKPAVIHSGRLRAWYIRGKKIREIC